MLGDLPIAPSQPATRPGQLSPTAIGRVAEEFEAVFLSTMMEKMFTGLDTDGPFGGGKSEDTWRSLLIEEYGKSIAASGGIGIADHIARELLALQEMNRHDDA